MITAHDKAIIAVIMAVVGLLNSFGITHFNLSESTVTELVMVLSPALVWLVPNKDAANIQNSGGRG